MNEKISTELCDYESFFPLKLDDVFKVIEEGKIFINQYNTNEYDFYSSSTNSEFGVAIPKSDKSPLIYYKSDIDGIYSTGLSYNGLTLIKPKEQLEYIQTNVSSKNKDYLTKIPALPDGTPVLEEGRTKLGQELGHYWYSVWERSPDGQLIINSNGIPRKTPFSVDTGAISPDFEASISNTFAYKNFTVNFLLAGRFGGITQDGYENDLWRTGSHPDAIHPERELSNIAYINGTDPKTMQIDGVAIVSGDVTYDPDGNILEDTRVFEPSTYKVDYQSWATGYAAAWQNLIKDRTFIKLREVSLSYIFPKSILDKTFLNTASISVIGRDLLYWEKDRSFVDLDAWTIGGSRDTDLQMPTPRSIGFNLNFTF